MDAFDFQGVADWMEFLGWRWVFGEDKRVPDIYEIKKRARELLREAAKNGTGYISTEGFTARYTSGNTPTGPALRLSLAFGYESIKSCTSYTEPCP